MKLGYWNLRGKAASTRLMLAYKGIGYEDVRYEVDKKNPTESHWFKIKETLGFAFPNLPYLIDGDVKLTQSSAINRYLGRKLDLAPSNETEERVCEEVDGFIGDILYELSSLLYGKNFNAEKLEKTKLQQLQNFKRIDTFLYGRDFVAGSRLTYVDFCLYEAMDKHRLLYRELFNSMSNIEAYIARFEALEPISTHLTSKDYRRYPMYAPFAAWGGQDYDDRTW